MTNARSILLVLTLLLAGCTDPSADDGIEGAASRDDATVEQALEVVGGTVEGTLWLPPSQGPHRVETLVEVPANFSGVQVVAEIVVGTSYGPAELPATIADVLVELRGPDGDVLADAHLTGAERAATLEATTKMDGAHTLALLSYGGSDGAANGDHVHYRVEGKGASG